MWSTGAAPEKEEWTSDENYTLDGEVFELRLHLDHAMGERSAFHVELPWRQISEGSLDGFIDDWHGVFGLPGGSRRRLPEDELLIEFRQGDATLLYFDESASGIGDIPIAVGYQLHAADSTALAVWLTAKRLFLPVSARKNESRNLLPIRPRTNGVQEKLGKWR